MVDIVLKKKPRGSRGATHRRAYVTVSADIHEQLSYIAHETGITITALADRLLEEALRNVRVED